MLPETAAFGAKLQSSLSESRIKFDYFSQGYQI